MNHSTSTIFNFWTLLFHLYPYQPPPHWIILQQVPSIIHMYIFQNVLLEWLFFSIVSLLHLIKANLYQLHLTKAGNRSRQWHPTPVHLPGQSYGRRSLLGGSPWGRTESDTTERLHFHFSLSCIGEGNGNPLQCSCLENPRDGEAWWAAVYGVAQSRTWLKWLNSSSKAGKNWQ